MAFLRAGARAREPRLAPWKWSWFLLPPFAGPNLDRDMQTGGDRVQVPCRRLTDVNFRQAHRLGGGRGDPEAHGPGLDRPAEFHVHPLLRVAFYGLGGLPGLAVPGLDFEILGRQLIRP